MAIDVLHETTLPLTEVPNHVPPMQGGKRISQSAVSRWVTHGIRTPAGVIRLEARRLGRRWVTSHEALGRFLQGLCPSQRAGRTRKARGVSHAG